MKRRILTCILVAISIGMLTLSVLQLSTRVVKAAGCPSDPFPGCLCNLNNAISVQSGNETHWYCTYDCYCGQPGGSENFLIEREYSYTE